MKQQDLEVGCVYWDGKLGVRKLLERKGESITYQVLAAKVESEHRYDELGRLCESRSLIGESSTCLDTSFLSWARHKMTAEAGEALVLRLRASRLKLSPAQRTLMVSLATQCDDAEVRDGKISILIERDERRAASGCEEKGLLVRVDDLNVRLTRLGAAWAEVLREQTHKPAPVDVFDPDF